MLCVAIIGACSGVDDPADGDQRRKQGTPTLADVALDDMVVDASDSSRVVSVLDDDVLVLTAADTARALVLIRVAAETVVTASDHLELGREIPSVVELVPLADAERIVRVTYDMPWEGLIGTVLFAVNGTTWTRIYLDEPGAACKPADLKDLNGDGRMELLRYSGDPAAHDCADPCHAAIASQVSGHPSWIDVMEWREGDRAWRNTSESFPGFYAELALQYGDILQWLEHEDQAGACKSPPGWSKEPREVIGEFRQRARDLALASRSGA